MKKKRLSVSLVIPQYHNMFSTFYTLEIVREVSRAAIDFDVDLLIETAWRARPGSGLLFADVMNNERWIKAARAKRIPYLLLNHYDADSRENCIGIDNEKASFEAVDYLVQSGHRRIAHITGKLNAQTGVQRLEGYRRALKANRIDPESRYLIKGTWSADSGKAAMRKLLSLKSPPTAVFVAGDEMAIGAMEEVRTAGLKVPQDISFVGFDNIPQADLPEVSLTTVEQPFADMATLGVKYLIQLITHRPSKPVKVILENTRLIKRGSVRNLS